MKIKHGTDYYVASNEYEGLRTMTLIRTHGDDEYPDPGECYMVHRSDEGDWLWSGYVKVEDLLTADQIIKMRDYHLMMADAFERHG